MYEPVKVIEVPEGRYIKDTYGVRWKCVHPRIFIRQVDKSPGNFYIDKFGEQSLVYLLPESCTGFDWQPPKPEPHYRQFANPVEYWPFRNMLVRMPSWSPKAFSRVTMVGSRGISVDGNSMSYQKFFEEFVFIHDDESTSHCGLQISPEVSSLEESSKRLDKK